MDIISSLLSPLGIVGISLVLGGPLLYFVLQPKNNTFVIERLKPGYNILRGVKEKKTSNPGDYVLSFKDGRKFIIPKENEKECEVLNIPRSLRIKKGYRKLWLLENNQIVKMGSRFVDDMTALITPEMIAPLLNRGSLRRLAAGKGGAQSWTMVLLAGVAAFAIGYILYPMFNHPPPVIECYRILANGSRVFQGYC